LNSALEELDSITKPILDEFIDLSKIDSLSQNEINEVSTEFGGISFDEIKSNSEEIQKYYSALASVEIIEKVEQVKILKAGDYSDDYNKLNFREKLIILMHPFLIDEYKDAGEKAKSWTSSKWAGTYSNNNYTDNLADSYRHILWNYLMCKYFASEISNVSNCISYVKRLADAHELNEATEISHAMDYHNNEIGRNWFLKTAYYDKKCWVCKVRLVCPSESDISEIIISNNCTKQYNRYCTTVTEINETNILTAVRIKDK